MDLEGEIRNLVKVCLVAAASLSYCYIISSKIPKGLMRLISFLPVIYIFLLLPLSLSSVMLQQSAGLFIAWLANFKLLLLALGPDGSSSKLSLVSFILITALPIEIKRIPYKNSKNPATNINLLSNFVLPAVLWCFLFTVYVKKPCSLLAKPFGMQSLFTFRLALSVQLSYMFTGVITSKLLKHELELQFDEPHLSTSLQNFWGKRWNRMTSSVLRSTIYTPTRSMLKPAIGMRWSRSLAILATFTVSGLMHEMVYIYMGMEWPTWEVTRYFIVTGVCVAIEIEGKQKASEMGWALHPFISCLLTFGFLCTMDVCFLYAELVRSGTDAREVQDYVALVNYAKNWLRI